MSDLLELVKTRKSVRTFDGRSLTGDDRAKIEAFFPQTENPFGIPVEFRLIEAEKYGLSSPVLSGEKLYVAGKVKKGPYADVAYGFSLEKLVLFAWSLGIGTVWIGGTMKRELFEKALGLSPDEMMPCMSPLGYPAARRSVKEVMMRKGIRADGRKEPGELFFDGSFEKSLTAPDDVADALEMVRWAPSAVNKQPWRVVALDGVYHFYEKKDKGYVSESVGDMQKVDLGIALCHFSEGLRAAGKSPVVAVSDPGIAHGPELDYIASVTP